jgi:hypothetical protein
VGLAHEASGVNLVVEDNEGPETCGQWGGGDLDRGQQVGWAVWSGQRGIAHGTGDDDRPIIAHEQVQSERRLLDGVSAL